jgi:hypothetical protein
MELKAIDQINPNEAAAKFMSRDSAELSPLERELKKKLRESGEQLAQHRQMGQRLAQELKNVEAEMLRLEGGQRELIDMVVNIEIAKRKEADNGSAEDMDQAVNG